MRRDGTVVARLIAVGLLLIALLLALHALGELLQKLVERGAQLLGKLLDLLVRGAALQRLAQLLLRRAQIPLGVGEIAVLDAQRHLPEKIGDGEHVRIGARALQAIQRRVQAEIDARRGAELVGRDEQRFERILDAGALVRRENEVAALLDQRTRQRLHEGSLRQEDFDRVARALVIAFVAGMQRHADTRAGPGIFREVDGRGGIAEIAGRGGQRQAGARRIDEMAAGDRLVADDRIVEARLGADHAVIIVDLVGERERAAHVRLRLLAELDRRRVVGDRGEVEGAEDRAALAQRQPGVAFQREAGLAGLLAGRGAGRLRIGGRLRRLEPALRLDGDGGGVGSADDDRRADRRGEAGGVGLRLRAVARLQHDRRLAGIGRRVDPGVDARARGRGGAGAAPVEGGGEAGIALGAGDEGGGDHRDEGGGAKRIAVAPRHLRRGRREFQPGDIGFEAAAVQRPERLRPRVGRAAGERVVEGGGRAVRHAGIAVEAGEALAARGPTEARLAPEREGEREREQCQPGDARPGRHDLPEARPRERDKAADDRQNGRGGTPDVLPGEGRARGGKETPQALATLVVESWSVGQSKPRMELQLAQSEGFCSAHPAKA